MDYASGEYLYKLVSANIWPANYARRGTVIFG